MESIVKAEVHRLVVVDDENKVCGVISLSDILSFLVLRPSGESFLSALFTLLYFWIARTLFYRVKLP